MHNLNRRSPQEVFEDHLRTSYHGALEDDIARNYAEDVVLLTGHGVFHGHDGVRYLAQQLREELPECTFYYHTQQVARQVGFLEWSASSKTNYVDDGADSYLIHEGRIVLQTIHYTVKGSLIAWKGNEASCKHQDPSRPVTLSPDECFFVQRLRELGVSQNRDLFRALSELLGK